MKTKLADMKVDFRACDTYFTTELTKNETGAVNTEFDDLLTMVNALKGEIGK